jgi:predicted Rossmann fold nucleotide-binding protein DprA/Smf involved in DNA uptake
MKIAIIGSRRRKDFDKVKELISTLNPDDTVISGGCIGIDTQAIYYAKQRGLDTIIYAPDLSDIKHKGDMVRRYYDRNKKIAESCDVLFAFVATDRTGGTENTITYARQLHKTVYIMDQLNIMEA